MGTLVKTIKGIKVRCDLCRRRSKILDVWEDEHIHLDNLVRSMGWYIGPTPFKKHTTLCPRCLHVATMAAVAFKGVLEDDHA